MSTYETSGVPKPPESPEDIVEKAPPRLFATADEVADKDIENHLPPGLPSPLPGDLAVVARGRGITADLVAAQRREAWDLRVTRTQHQDVLTAHADGEDVVVPDTVPRVRVMPLEFVAMGVVGIIETVAVTDAVAGILDLPSDGFERYLLPAVFALFGATLAHQFAAHALEARRARAPRIQDHERRVAWGFAVLVLLLAGAPVLARVHNATVDAQLAGGTSVLPDSVGFFVIFQLGFVAMSLGLAHWYHRRLGVALDEREQRWLEDLKASIPALDDKIANAAERHDQQHQALVAATAEAITYYRRRLAQEHPDGTARAVFTARGKELLDGSLLALLLPDERPAGGGALGTGSAGVPSAPTAGPPPPPADPTPPPPADPTPPPTAGPPPPPTGPTPSSAETADAGSPDDDLFTRITTPPAGRHPRAGR